MSTPPRKLFPPPESRTEKERVTRSFGGMCFYSFSTFQIV